MACHLQEHRLQPGLRVRKKHQSEQHTNRSPQCVTLSFLWLLFQDYVLLQQMNYYSPDSSWDSRNEPKLPVAQKEVTDAQQKSPEPKELAVCTWMVHSP